MQIPEFLNLPAEGRGEEAVQDLKNTTGWQSLDFNPVNLANAISAELHNAICPATDSDRQVQVQSPTTILPSMCTCDI